MKRLLIAGLTSLIIIIIGCGTETGTGPGGTPMPMPYQEEAEQMALYYSGEFRPPAPLTSRISSELYAIRSTLGEQIPEVKWPFVLPWYANTVSTTWTDSAAALIRDSMCATLDSLVRQFDLTYTQWSMFPRYVTITSHRPVHPWHFADSIKHAPGVRYAGASERPQPWGSYFARTAVFGEADYYYWLVHCPDLWGRLLWIRVRGGKAVLMGEHYECPPVWDDVWDPSLPWMENYQRMDQWIADAETNRPAWVDKARAEFAKLSIFGPHHEFGDK